MYNLRREDNKQIKTKTRTSNKCVEDRKAR